MSLRALVGITVLVLGAALSGKVAQAATLVSCGQVVTTSIELANDLSNCPGDGLVIGADHVALDLNGHTIDGSGTGTGVLALGRVRVTIRNGVVRDFADGVALAFSSDSTVANIETAVSVAGIRLHLTGNSLLVNNRAIGGNSGVTAFRSNRNLILGNGAHRSTTGFAVLFSDRNSLFGNVASANGTGFLIAGTAVFGSSRLNHLVANVATGNTSNGIEVIGESFLNTLTSNLASGNGNLGIFAVPGNVDGGGNKASGNGNPAQCVGVSCS